MSPSSPCEGSSSSLPGRSSSIGKDITSVGPGRSIHCRCNCSIAASSTAITDSSDSGWIRMRWRVKRAASRTARSSISQPDSLLTSIAMVVGRLLSVVGLRLVVPLVSVDDTSDQLMAYDIGTGEPGEVHVLHPLQDHQYRRRTP